MGRKRHTKTKSAGTGAAEAKTADGEEGVDAEPIRFSRDDGMLLLRNPDLFRYGRERFCNRLAQAAARQQHVRAVEISLPSPTCRIDFEPGRVDATAMANRFAEAVRSAIKPDAEDAPAEPRAAGWTTLLLFPSSEGRSAWEVWSLDAGSIRLRNRLLRNDSTLAKRVAGAVFALPGVISSGDTFWRHDLNVRFDPDRLSPEAIVGAAEQMLRQALQPAPDSAAPSAHDEPAVVRGLKRVWYLALAGSSFGMTLVAFLVPGVPTVPFLLATSYYLARSSPRLNRMLRRSRFFGPILEDLQTYGGLRPLNRFKLVALTLTLGLVVLVVIGPPFLVLLLTIGAITASVYFIMRIPEVPGRKHPSGLGPEALAGATG